MKGLWLQAADAGGSSCSVCSSALRLMLGVPSCKVLLGLIILTMKPNPGLGKDNYSRALLLVLCCL